MCVTFIPFKGHRKDCFEHYYYTLVIINKLMFIPFLLISCITVPFPWYANHHWITGSVLKGSQEEWVEQGVRSLKEDHERRDANGTRADGICILLLLVITKNQNDYSTCNCK